MDKQQAAHLIRETFEKPFDKVQFIRFIKELLNRIEEAPFSYQGQYIPDAYKPYISSLERIGKFNDSENRIDILVIKLQRETSLERARTMQRNFVAGYLQGKFGSSPEKEAALVAFVSPDEVDWRFSLVKMDYRFEQTKTGRTRVKEEFTPARRWSFLVGANEKSHTAQSRLVNIVANDEQPPTLAEFEKAFNIETVTKEFFLKYRDLFIRTKEALDKVVNNDARIKAEFEAKGVNTVDFSKKLLGQIIFLYFLQKKGWFGAGRDADWGDGSKQFLRELFEKKHGGYSNFFNDILEPLFYEALRNDRSHDDDYYSRFNCKIPFLNGGLFDPIGNYDWVHADIIFPDKLFSNTNKTREGDTGDGILDTFDRYNFTVKEDEPLEKEVAIDPELLGKAYEKFNAIRPDNFEDYKKALKSGKKGDETKFNKQFGVYYTPREIVHYMCQQSLIQYLTTELEGKAQKEDIEILIHFGEQVSENEARVLRKGKETDTYSYQLPESIRRNAELIDRKLADIAVCDPAAGSGAFPVGMMSEIVRARTVLSTFIENKANRTPYNFKHRCIEHSLYGVDIDPGAVEIAKLRLWLSLVVDEDDIKNIKPLPNLDYKIVCGNSLLGVEKNLFNHLLFNDLEKVKPFYFNETNPTKKQDYKRQIDTLISRITNGHTEFDFEVYFSEVFHQKGGFDVVIGNPPYGFRNVLSKTEKIYYRKIENIEFSSGDSAELFCKKCFNKLVKDNGIITFIIPKKSLYGDAWDGFRREYWLKYNLKFFLDSGKAFDDVLLEANVFGLVKNSDKGQIKCAFLEKNNQITEFGAGKYKDIFMDNSTAQIYRLLIPDSIWDKIKSAKTDDVLVNGRLGLAIGTEYFSDIATEYKLLKGIDIGRWIVKSHRWLKNKQKLNWSQAKVFLTPKVIAQRLVSHIENPVPHIKVTACYDLEGIIITNTLMSFELNEKINPKFWLAYLNSSFVSWYVYNFIYARAIRTMDFYDFYIKQIPVPQKAIIKEYQKPFEDIIDKILSLTQSEYYLQNPAKQAQVKEYEKQIDRMVYELYGLTEEEIAIVEGGDDSGFLYIRSSQ